MTDTAPAGDAHEVVVDTSLPQFTVRAIVTGMVMGAILSLCNIYLGLKIGWGQNMSITAALLGFGIWGLGTRLAGTRDWNILENNVNQTTASAAASISSAGLVAPIPALTMITGETLTWPVLSFWVLSVAVLGVVVAVGLRRQMLITDKLPFPNGIATGETLKEMYARGQEAVAKVMMLISGAVVATVVKLIVEIGKVGKLAFPGEITASATGALAAKGVGGASLKNLGFVLDPSLLFVGIGAIIGARVGISLLLGAIVSWLVLGPMVLEAGYANPGAPDKLWFGSMIEWMLWPGVALMVTASLTSFAFSWRSVVAAMTGSGRKAAEDFDPSEVPRNVFLRLAGGALVLSVALQAVIFGIGVGLAIFGVALTFILAIVAARVSGETGITPVGAMGKVTQLTIGVVAPGDVTTNLMTANVTGGAASQCGDLLHDMKTGMMIGASPKLLTMAQLFGVLAGALAGSAAYLLMIPDPTNMLLTDEWAAPAVAQWKAVAELFAIGIESMPGGAGQAMLWAGILGVVLAVLEKTAPKRARKLVPSPTALGLAAVVPAYYSISMCFGGLLALLAARITPSWSARFVIVLASGLIAGESLTGFGVAVQKIIAGD